MNESLESRKRPDTQDRFVVEDPGSESQHIPVSNCWSSSNYPFETDYNDHFETPLSAYRDVKPILDAYLANLPSREQILYDPYYCNGRTKHLLSQLGYEQILHDCRDFYTEARSADEYAVLITNPPFSSDHKQRCLEFCVHSGRPWLVLLPAYCITKQYVTQLIGARFCIPSKMYHYDHPEATGHSVCPFRESVWICGGFPTEVVEQWTTSSIQSAAQSLQVSLRNRPNPKQRKKKRLDTESHRDLQCPTSEEKLPVAGKQTQKKSKYRDASGNRTKRRF